MPEQKPLISIHQGRTEADAHAICKFMLMNAAAEMAEVPVDEPILLKSITHTVSDGAALVAIIGEEIVGYLGIVQVPYSYSRASFLADTGFYVLPQYRDGDVSRALLQEARGIADAAGMAFKLVRLNPSKPPKTRSRMAKTAEILAYLPAGSVITFFPRGKDVFRQ